MLRSYTNYYSCPWCSEAIRLSVENTDCATHLHATHTRPTCWWFPRGPVFEHLRVAATREQLDRANFSNDTERPN